MHLKFFLPYVLLAIYKKPFLTSDNEGVTSRGFRPVQGENAGSGSGAGDVWVAEG